MRKIIIFSALILVYPIQSYCNEDNCNNKPEIQDTVKKITRDNPKKNNKGITEINLYCGDNRAVQNIENPAVKNIEPDKKYPSLLMEIIYSIVKLTEALAWPITAILISYFFKKELSALLSRLKRGKLGSTEFEFENYVREVNAETNIDPSIEGGTISPAKAAQASADPRGAIVTAWIDVENALFNLVKTRGLDSGPSRLNRQVIPALREIVRAQALDPSYISLFHDLRIMRNEAAHTPDFSPTPDAVYTYLKLAAELTNALKEAANNPVHN